MPKNERQKLKLLYLARILSENTDADHPMTMAQLLNALSECGVAAERKSVYDDLASLGDFGMDIEKTSGRVPGYYLASRTLELTELKLLVDAVQSSRFITRKKSTELIGKLGSLASVHEARALTRDVFVAGRAKTMNETIYYSVDELHRAMRENRTVRFQYFDWNMRHERVLRHDGKIYEVSPWQLLWEDDNYYLLAYDEAAELLKHFRVDRILNISVTEMPRAGGEKFRSIDVAQYAKKVFGMYGGEEELVVLRCDASLSGVIFDRFGAEISLCPDGDGFTAAVRVLVSPQFFSWAASFGDKLVIDSPETVRDRMRAFLAAAAAPYEDDPAR